ncbi:MAG: gliding motility protein GldN [Bacteroidetes bacterium]|nr:MAG: gliding motility protein GldN [Bacteroidota bacterium]
MRSLVLSVFLGLGIAGTYAQIEEINGGPVNVPTEGIIDGVFIQEHIPTKRMIPYEYVREADAIWSRRVWEYIDLREKINLPMYYPLDEITSYGWVRNATRWSLWTVIRQHVLNGDLRVFSPYDPASYGLGAWDGDQLKYPIDPQPGLNFYTDSVFREEMVYYLGRLGPQSDVPLTDEYGDPLVITLPDGTMEYSYPPRDTIWFNSADIVQYRLKEDWFIDKERSVLDVRIIAIAPVVYKKDEDAAGNVQISGMTELFWLYFPHCRFVFNNYFVYNDKNDAQWMSFDDLFWKRRFNSVAYKVSNTYDRKIESYRSGVDALFESEAIKNEIRNIEHDVWSF